MKRIGAILLTFMMLSSCNLVSSIIHDGELVARVGKHKLYSSELEMYIPNGVSAEDSTALAAQYINSWATDWLYMDAVKKEGDKQEFDVTREIEDYRHALIRYRYEQDYVDTHMDTTVTDAQKMKYYTEHKSEFNLSSPILKGRLVKVVAESPYLDELKELMVPSAEDSTAAASDSLLHEAVSFADYTDKWKDASSFAKELGTDYRTMLSGLKDGYCEILDKDSGILSVAYVSEMVPAGDPAPVDYVGDKIKNIILSLRKQDLISGLERSLLEEARSQDKFVIYK